MIPFNCASSCGDAGELVVDDRGERAHLGADQGADCITGGGAFGKGQHAGLGHNRADHTPGATDAHGVLVEHDLVAALRGIPDDKYISAAVSSSSAAPSGLALRPACSAD